MTKLSDLRDIVVFILVSLAWVFSTIFLFGHPTDLNFTTWAGLALTITSTYHWICMKDDKVKDAA